MALTSRSSESDHPGAPKCSGAGVPVALRLMATVHVASLALCSIAVTSASFVASSSSSEESRAVCSALPRQLIDACKCAPIGGDEEGESGVRIICKALHSTSHFNLDEVGKGGGGAGDVLNAISGGDRVADEHIEMLGRSVKEILIRDGAISTIKMRDFSSFSSLRMLSVTNSGVAKLVVAETSAAGETVRRTKAAARTQTRNHLSLESLDLSRNLLTELDEVVLGEYGSHLKELNVSHNSIHRLGPAFEGLTKLEVLDLSANRLDEDIDSAVFTNLPKSIKYLDISSNAWLCSPKLSWMYSWSQHYTDSSSSILRHVDDTRCRYDETTKDCLKQKQCGNLLLVMEYYHEKVNPSCPNSCSCFLTQVQEVMKERKERSYTVQVNCTSQNLTYFPKLPIHTRIVDLSDNKLDSQAFSNLNVKKHNYSEVDKLYLDNNQLDNLPEKLLKMRLKVRFSAKNNKLTTIPFEFSKHIMKTTGVVELSNNPWKCTCASQVTDLNLINKIGDKSKMKCGPESDLEVKDKPIVMLNQEVLCPPESNGEVEELFLRLLCLVLAVLIVAVLSKLAYDYWVYRTRGQLPWLVLKMP